MPPPHKQISPRPRAGPGSVRRHPLRAGARLRRSLGVLIVALAAVTSSARAQDASRTDRARALFEEGLRLGEEEQWGAAADRFRRAYDLVPSPGIAVNLASALIPLGRLAEARGILRRLIAHPDASREVRQLANQLLEQEVEPQIGWLTIRLRGPTRGVRVTVDDDEVPAGSLQEPVAVDPGRHTISALRGGEPVAHDQVTMTVAGSATVTLRVPPPRIAPVTSPVQTPERSEDAPADEPAPRDRLVRKWWLWTAVAGVVLVSGIGIGVAASGGGAPAPVEGNTDPPVVEGRVGP